MIPSLEALEPRELPAAPVYLGGPVAYAPALAVLYVGAVPNEGDVAAALSYLAGTQDAGQLAAYGIAPGPLDGGASAPDPGPSLPDFAPGGGLSPLQSVLVSAIAAGKLPAPAPGQLYAVFLPPGCGTADPQGTPSSRFLAYHWDFAWRGQTVPYLVFPWPKEAGGYSSFDWLTAAISHEYAEACTDPVPGTGWLVPLLPGWPPSQEIGDPSEGILWRANGYLVQGVDGPQGLPYLGPSGQTIQTCEWELAWDGLAYAAGDADALRSARQNPLWGEAVGSDAFWYGESLFGAGGA